MNAKNKSYATVSTINLKVNLLIYDILYYNFTEINFAIIKNHNYLIKFYDNDGYQWLLKGILIITCKMDKSSHSLCPLLEIGCIGKIRFQFLCQS